MSTEKLLKVAKELRKASQMHANQAKVVANMARSRTAPLKAFASDSPAKKLSAGCIAMAKRKFKVYPSAYANMYASKQQKKGKC